LPVKKIFTPDGKDIFIYTIFFSAGNVLKGEKIEFDMPFFYSSEELQSNIFFVFENENDAIKFLNALRNKNKSYQNQKHIIKRIPSKELNEFSKAINPAYKCGFDINPNPKEAIEALIKEYPKKKK
jgi:hypothetical protein